MAYKDRDKEREAARIRKQRQRNVTPSKNVTPFVTPSLPPERIEGIKAILVSRKRMGCPDDSKARWQRALDYRKWELAQ